MRATTLLLALAVLLPPLAHADEAEEAAAKLVKKLGGKVSRDGKSADNRVVVADLGKSKVTDRDLKGLAGLKHLRVLNLFGTPVTDEGLKDLAALKELEGLDLRATKVTGKGLKDLAALKGLRSLLLDKDTPDKAVDDLRKALPDCKIVR